MFLNWAWLILILRLQCSSGLLLERLEVPRLAKLFEPLKIACRYRLGTFRLESVKWYKDEEEFFRFTPSGRPRTRNFSISGIQINMENSDMHVVSLSNVSVSTAGVYRCEISSDGPDFETIQESMKMDVYYPPDEQPNVIVNKTVIEPNKETVALCVSGKSFPAQKLNWFLNGIKANKECIEKEYPTVDNSGLFRSYSFMKFRAVGVPGPIRISCVGFQGEKFSPVRGHAELIIRGRPLSASRMQYSTAPYTKMDSKLYYFILALHVKCLYAYH